MSIAYSIPRLPQQLDELARKAHEVETRQPLAAPGQVSTGWAYDPREPDPALDRGVLHEWFGVTPGSPGSSESNLPDTPLPLWQAAGARTHTLTLPLPRNQQSRAMESRQTAENTGSRTAQKGRFYSALSAASAVFQKSRSKFDHRKSAPWSPPLCILTHLARRGLQSMPRGWVIWIGKRVWPYPHLLLGGEDGRRLLDRSVWIDAPTAAERVWAIDQAVRCPAISVVVADGRGFNMPATRRLQLAARASSALLLVARPPHEQPDPSAATTRWAVHAEPSSIKSPRWNIELLRYPHGSYPVAAQRNWVVELDRAQGEVRPATHVVSRTAAMTTQRQTA